MRVKQTFKRGKFAFWKTKYENISSKHSVVLHLFLINNIVEMKIFLSKPDSSVFILMLLFPMQADGFWGFFRKNIPSTKDPDPNVEGHSLQTAFAPFEVTNSEEKFLHEASHYLGNLPKLDQCNLLIVNRLRQSCNKMSEEELSKLGVNLLNCQSLSEGRKTYKCTDGMTLTECTAGMDSDTWNAYHIISNRARSVCYNLRQTEFRMKTEITVNKLATSALDNLGILQQLLTGQDKLKEATLETTTMIQEGQKDIIQNNNRLKKEQLLIHDTIVRNMKQLNSEKTLVSSRQKQIENFSRMVNTQLESLLNEFQRQGSLTKKGDKEILQNLEAVKGKSQMVLEKLESTLENMNTQYDTIEQKHSDTIKSMEDIQRTITFMNEVMKKLESNINEQISWLNYFVGGTQDKLTVISLLLGHFLYFLVAVLAVLFVGGSIFTKLVILFIFPMNTLMAVRGAKHFKLEELSIIILASYPVSWLAHVLLRVLSPSKADAEKDKFPTTLPSYEKSLMLPGVSVKEEPRDFEPEVQQCSSRPQSLNETVRNEVQRLLPHLTHVSTNGTRSAPATPKGRRKLLWSSTPVKHSLNDSSRSLPSTPTSEGKASRPRCSATTVKGTSCRNSVVGNLDLCRIHASKMSNTTLDFDEM